MKKYIALIVAVVAIACIVCFCFVSNRSNSQKPDAFALKDVDTATELGKSTEKLHEPEAEDKKAEPEAEDKKAEPKVEDKKAEPKVEDKKAEPKAEDKKSTGSSSDSSGGSGSDKGNSGRTTSSKSTYDITYNLDGGKLSGQKKTYKKSDADYKLPTPTKSGYKFMGWFEDKDADVTSDKAVAVLASGSTEDKIYYAKWAQYYTIGYVLNSATHGGAVPDKSKGKFDDKTVVVDKYTKYDEKFKLPVPYRNDGCTFLGWYEPISFGNTQAIAYSNKYLVTSIPKGTSGNKVYHAVWKDMEHESTETYFAIEDAIYDIEINLEVGTLVLSEKGQELMSIVQKALKEVLSWKGQNIIVSNALVRKVFTQETQKIKGIIDSFSSEERTEFENAIAVGLSVDTLDSMTNIFNINTNYGKN